VSEPRRPTGIVETARALAGEPWREDRFSIRGSCIGDDVRWFCHALDDACLTGRQADELRECIATKLAPLVLNTRDTETGLLQWWGHVAHVAAVESLARAGMDEQSAQLRDTSASTDDAIAVANAAGRAVSAVLDAEYPPGRLNPGEAPYSRMFVGTRCFMLGEAKACAWRAALSMRAVAGGNCANAARWARDVFRRSEPTYSRIRITADMFACELRLLETPHE
jgi:hypothetical protein